MGEASGILGLGLAGPVRSGGRRLKGSLGGFFGDFGNMSVFIVFFSRGGLSYG